MEPSVAELKISRRSIGARQNPGAAAAILDTATRLLAEKGLKGITTDAIAREARSSKATLYRWWPTRGALLLAVYMRMKRDHGYADTGSLTGDVASALDHLFAFWRGDGSVFALIIAEAQTDKSLIPALNAFREERIAEWAPALKRADERGELREGVSSSALPESIIAHAWFHLMTDRLDADINQLAADIVSPFLRTPRA
jgi:AcrR family transcriptional regulator